MTTIRIFVLYFSVIFALCQSACTPVQQTPEQRMLENLPRGAKPGSCYVKCIDEEKHTNWEEALCQRDVTPKVIHALQEKLLASGYQLEKNGIMDDATKAALWKYQKDNRLPVGSVNIKTLEQMGLKY